MSASAPGRSPSQELETAIPEPGAPPAVADLELAPGARVTGIVLDAATGSPLAGAQVDVAGRDAGPSALPATRSATSAPDGRFAIDGVPAGRPLSVYAHAEGHGARVVSGVEAPEGGESAPVSVSLPPLAPGEDPRVEVSGLGALLAAQGSALRVTSASGASSSTTRSPATDTRRRRATPEGARLLVPWISAPRDGHLKERAPPARHDGAQAAHVAAESPQLTDQDRVPEDVARRDAAAHSSPREDVRQPATTALGLRSRLASTGQVGRRDPQPP